MQLPLHETDQGDTLLEALRQNQRLLRELTVRFGIDTTPPEYSPTGVSTCSPQMVHNLLAPEMAHLPQEQLRVLLLDAHNQVVGQRVIYLGNVRSSVIRPAEILRPAVTAGVPSIIICHNHPSRDPTPSSADITVTKHILDGGKLLGVDLLDHVIIAGNQFTSLKETGKMD